MEATALCFKCRNYRKGTWQNSFEFECYQCQDEMAEVYPYEMLIIEPSDVR